MDILEEVKADAALIITENNRFYFTGFSTSFGAVLITNEKKYFFTDFRYGFSAREKVKDFTVCITTFDSLYSELNEIIEKAGVKLLAVEESILTVSQYRKIKSAFPDVKFKDCSPAVQKMRAVKRDDETEKIRAAQVVAEAALAKTVSGIKVGMTEREVSAELTYQMIVNGADGLSFDNIIAFGENAANCHHEPSDRKLVKGDIILIDCGAKLNGYCSDMTRCFVIGELSSGMAGIYKTVLECQEYILKNIGPGMTGYMVDAMAREFFRSRGYDKEFGHGLGHSLGIEIHEEPRLSRLSAGDTLVPGNIVTVEPGLYIEGVGGVRIEDMVLITKDGCENLTSYTKNINI